MKDKPMGRTKGGRPSAGSELPTPSHDEIARRAYELFQRRGGEPGHEQDDWLQAEQDLRGAEQPVGLTQRHASAAKSRSEARVDSASHPASSPAVPRAV